MRITGITWMLAPKGARLLIGLFYTLLGILFVVAFSYRYGTTISYSMAGSVAVTTKISAYLLGLLAMPLTWKAYWKFAVIHSIGMLVLTSISLKFYADSLPIANSVSDAIWIATVEYLKILILVGGLMITLKLAIRHELSKSEAEE